MMRSDHGMERVDVAIVGGGPAGLSAALILGRCCRTVVVIDAGEPRNRKADATHGYLTRDGESPASLSRAARADLAAYTGVRLIDGTVTDVTGSRGAFDVRVGSGPAFGARRVLLATGVADVVPDIEGVAELFGRSVHHCPHCDGYEYAGRPIGVYGQAGAGIEAVLGMLAWTDDVVLFTDGRLLTAEDRASCEEQGVVVREERVSGLAGQDGRLESVVLADGSSVPRAALFLVAGQREQSDLAKHLGCEINAEGVVVTDAHAVTSVPGIYAAGDMSVGEQMVVVAAAEGASAATKIHASLWEEDLRARRSRRSRISNAGSGSAPGRGVGHR